MAIGSGRVAAVVLVAVVMPQSGPGGVVRVGRMLGRRRQAPLGLFALGWVK
jgi:hypothetical protein